MVKRISAVLLSALMLVINMSLTFSTHYCGGEAVETSISLGKADVGCGMEMPEADDCDNIEDLTSITKKGCCENVHFTLSVEEDYKENSSSEIIDVPTDAVVAPVAITQKQDFIVKPSTFLAYSPPLIKQDITVLHQVFRL